VTSWVKTKLRMLPQPTQYQRGQDAAISMLEMYTADDLATMQTKARTPYTNFDRGFDDLIEQKLKEAEK